MMMMDWFGIACWQQACIKQGAAGMDGTGHASQVERTALSLSPLSSWEEEEAVAIKRKPLPTPAFPFPTTTATASQFLVVLKSLSRGLLFPREWEFLQGRLFSAFSFSGKAWRHVKHAHMLHKICGGLSQHGRSQHFAHGTFFLSFLTHHPQGRQAVGQWRWDRMAAALPHIPSPSRKHWAAF